MLPVTLYRPDPFKVPPYPRLARLPLRRYTFTRGGSILNGLENADDLIHVSTHFPGVHAVVFYAALRVDNKGSPVVIHNILTRVTFGKHLSHHPVELAINTGHPLNLQNKGNALPGPVQACFIDNGFQNLAALWTFNQS
ncbi:MAG: hypothetical protein PWP72_774 [Thermoanaerobacter sp.]|nr:hypothetical protein [Thermoanaerobacter sp.]